MRNRPPVFTPAAPGSIALAPNQQRSPEVTEFADGGTDGRNQAVVVVQQAPDDVIVSFDRDAGAAGQLILRRLWTERQPTDVEVALAVIGAEGGETKVRLTIERLQPLAEIGEFPSICCCSPSASNGP